jgi:hypothetical protein
MTAPIRCSVLFAALPLLAAAAPSGAPPWSTVLSADFQAFAAEQPLQPGSAAEGRPASIDPNIHVLVRDSPMATRSAQFAWSQVVGSGAVRFEFVDAAEPRTRIVSVQFDLHPQVTDRYSVFLREGKGASQNFGDLLFAANGAVRANDAAGSTLLPWTWQVGRTYAIQWLHDLDAGSYDLRVDNRVVLAGRGHGIDLSDPAQAGVGSVSFGLDNGASANAVASIDNLLVRVAPTIQAEDLVFNAAFDPI